MFYDVDLLHCSLISDLSKTNLFTPLARDSYKDVNLYGYPLWDTAEANITIYMAKINLIIMERFPYHHGPLSRDMQVDVFIK